MEHTYCVSAIAYDTTGCVTDFEHDFMDDLTDLKEAFSVYEWVIGRYSEDENDLFDLLGCPDAGSIVIQLEECEEDEEAINCVDVICENWFSK